MMGARIADAWIGIHRFYEASPRRFWVALGLVMAVSMGVVQLLGPGVVQSYLESPQLADRKVAANLAAFGEMSMQPGYHSFWRPPGNVLLLAGWSLFFGEGPVAIIALFGVHLSVVVAGSLCMADLCRRVGGGPGGAVMAVALLSTSPLLARYIGGFVGDIPAVALHWIWLYALYRAYKSPHPLRWFGIAALFLASGSAFRPVTYLFAPLLFLPAFLSRNHRRYLRGAALATVLGMAATTLPWCVRNYQRCGHFSPYAFTYAMLWQGSNWETRGLSHGPGTDLFYQRYRGALEKQPPRCFEPEIDEVYRKEFGELVRNQSPWKTGALWVANAARTWFGLDVGTGAGRSVKWYPLLIVHHLTLFAMALLCVRRIAWSPPLLIAVGFCVYLTGTHALMSAEPRYSLPMLPVLVVLAVSGLVRAIENRVSPKPREAAAATGQVS